ncbi:hypothetical protein GCM10010344_37940 [Streptomyces bluensis]|nr:hypothetical protein GCM10010344_37940 [Streptomyces bluensis]
MGAIALAVGIIGLGAVGAAVIVFTVIRRRRTSGTGSAGPHSGTYPQSLGYPPQQPFQLPTQQQYPATAPNQRHLTPPGQPLQHPNPYAQQPPHQG